MADSSPAMPTVVVLGGGYAGIQVARPLDDLADVVLVEPEVAACPGVAERLSEPRVSCNYRATRFAEGVLDSGQRRTDHDSGFGHAFDQGLVQLGVRRDVGHHIDTGGHDLLDTGRRAHVSDDD